MARKKSIFGKLRAKKAQVPQHEPSNLGLRVETMDDEYEDDLMFEDEEVIADDLLEEDMEMEDDMMYEEDDMDHEHEGVEEEDMEELEIIAEEDEDELESEYEGQLTIDVFQTDKEIVISSTIAGVKPEDIDVSIDNDMVTIKGERKNDFKVEEDDYYYQECYWGSFSRSVILPVDVLPDKAQAELKNGILTIKLPKAKQTKSKKISVKAL